MIRLLALIAVLIVIHCIPVEIRIRYKPIRFGRADSSKLTAIASVPGHAANC